MVDEAVDGGHRGCFVRDGIPIRLRGLADLNGDGSWSRMRSIP